MDQVFACSGIPFVSLEVEETLTYQRIMLTVLLSMFLLYFVNAFQSSITGNLTAYVLSGFDAHSLIPLISIVSNVMCAAAYLPVAKLLNVWGRPQGFLIMASLSTLGLILMATTKDVQTYCAAQASSQPSQIQLSS
jgi:MFS family permease